MKIPDWEAYIGKLAALLIAEQSPQALVLAREHLYELLTNCIPPDVILKVGDWCCDFWGRSNVGGSCERTQTLQYHPSKHPNKRHNQCHNGRCWSGSCCRSWTTRSSTSWCTGRPSTSTACRLAPRRSSTSRCVRAARSLQCVFVCLFALCVVYVSCVFWSVSSSGVVPRLPPPHPPIFYVYQAFCARFMQLYKDFVINLFG